MEKLPLREESDLVASPERHTINEEERRSEHPIADGHFILAYQRPSIPGPRSIWGHALLIEFADTLMGCVEGSPEEAKLSKLVAVLERYGEKALALCKIAGSKG